MSDLEEAKPIEDDGKEWWEVRLSPEVVQFFQGMGPNWMERMDQSLLMFVRAGGIWKSD